MSETKETRIASANEYIRRLNEAALRIRYEPVRSLLKETASAIGNLRDAQYLFDSGEKELLRLYERYLPYLMEIVSEYTRLEESGNYDALMKNREKLMKTIRAMNDTVRSITKLLPQDEIDEANARQKAEELRRQLEEQHRSMLQ